MLISGAENGSWVLEALLSRGLGLGPATGQGHLKALALAIGLEQQSTLFAEIA